MQIGPPAGGISVPVEVQEGLERLRLLLPETPWPDVWVAIPEASTLLDSGEIFLGMDRDMETRDIPDDPAYSLEAAMERLGSWFQGGCDRGTPEGVFFAAVRGEGVTNGK